MPAKHEHVVRCRLSKRQRLLYDEYMAASDVQDTLSGGSFLGIINVLMQLRKVRGYWGVARGGGVRRVCLSRKRRAMPPLCSSRA